MRRSKQTTTTLTDVIVYNCTTAIHITLTHIRQYIRHS